MPATTPAPRRASAGSAPASERDPPVGVVLASDQHLIGEAVAAALASRGFRMIVLAWPRGVRATPVQRQLDSVVADVGVLLYDVDMSLRMTEARSLLRAWSGPWLVLTGAPAGPAWGGLLVAGASAVRASDLSLTELESLLHRVAAGGPDPESGRMSECVAAWRALQERHGDLQSRLDSLAPRELEVLVMLSRGVRVRTIANRLGLSETTVRTQVRSVLRKLGARSQLGAVAMLHAIDRSG
jgi:two-component system, NarL family, nitrate/nitrite response regulator NarL